MFVCVCEAKENIYLDLFYPAPCAFVGYVDFNA